MTIPMPKKRIQCRICDRWKEPMNLVKLTGRQANICIACYSELFDCLIREVIKLNPKKFNPSMRRKT